MDNLAALLNDGVRFDPRYLPDFNSDHLPMALCAIHGLGGSIDDLHAFRDSYLPLLREISPAAPAPNWRGALGQVDRYPSVFGLLDAEIGQRGAPAVIQLMLPDLLPGMAAEAFHPLIRLAYSIVFDAPRESAAALAYMVCTHVPVPVPVPFASSPPGQVRQTIDLAQVLRAQAGQPPPDGSGRFGRGLAALLHSNEYPLGCAESLRACALASLDLYRATRNFFALHMVTATHAARICAGVVSEERVLSALTGALLAAHRIVGAPSFARSDPVTAPASLDAAHALKYVYSCQAEYAAWGDERYLEEIELFRHAGLVPAWAGTRRQA